MSDENIISRNLYPWNGHYVREDDNKWAGAIQANFMRGKGDMMGMAGNHNDGADITTGVKEFLPNDYGLYHMAGNVSEWVMDAYKVTSRAETWDLDPVYLDEKEPRKIVRGGSWKDIGQQSRDMANGLGLRLIAVVFDGRNGDRIGQR